MYRERIYYTVSSVIFAARMKEGKGSLRPSPMYIRKKRGKYGHERVRPLSVIIMIIYIIYIYIYIYIITVQLRTHSFPCPSSSFGDSQTESPIVLLFSMSSVLLLCGPPEGHNEIVFIYIYSTLMHNIF